MELGRWLEEHDVRLSVQVTAELDPKRREPVWICTISGIEHTSDSRPATFIETADGSVFGRASAPGDAYFIAVRMLRGKTVNILYRGRDETLTFPDLTAQEA